MLDYLPNADHAGLYAALADGEFARAGLDVELQRPSDPSAPLKLLAAGKADLAISYEPELLLARDKGLKLVSVGAIVQRPLTSIMSLQGEGRPRPRDLQGKRVGTAGHPLPARLPEDDPRRGRRAADLGQGGQRRLQPRAGDAVQEGRRDARRVLERRGRPARSASKRTRRSSASTRPACRPTTSWSSSRAEDARATRRRTCGAFVQALARGLRGAARGPGGRRRRARRAPTATSTAAFDARAGPGARCRRSSRPTDEAVRLAGRRRVGALRPLDVRQRAAQASRRAGGPR